MEYKDKFQKKFSDLRQGVASRSPVHKSRSNSVIRRNNPKVTKPKETDMSKSRMEKKGGNTKTPPSTTTPAQPTIIRDLELQLSTLNSTLKHLPISNVKEITSYYQIVKQFIKEMITSPLYNVLKLLHSVYTIPLPTLITRNEFSTKIYTQQSQNQLQISQLLDKSKASLTRFQNTPSTKSSKILTTNTSVMEPDTLSKDTSSKKMGFKLNMNKIQVAKENVKDYFDEFYDNINEFSESWREQALRQKR